MKRLIGLILFLLVSFSSENLAQTEIALGNSVFAAIKGSTENDFDSKYRVIEANYLAGLQSGNTGIKTSCAYFLGELKSQKALFPLMKTFREAKSAGIKLIVAQSLLKIGDSRGVYLVKRESEIGNSSDIKAALQFLYMDYCLKTNGKIDSN